jgi:hypothetical protein
LRGDDAADWSQHPIDYRSTGGAAYVALRNCEDKHKRDMMLFIEFHTNVVRGRVPIDAAHKAFLAIASRRTAAGRQCTQVRPL